MDSRLYASLQESFKQLGTNVASGLTDQEARERITRYKKNSLHGTDPYAPLKLCARQFYNPLVIIMLLATVLSYLVESKLQAVIILTMLLINALLGWVQEFKAAQTLEALKKKLRSRCTVLRNGIKTIIPSEYLVPGDIVLFGIGDIIQADVRIISCKNVMANEALLTGEATPTEKQATDQAIILTPGSITHPAILYAGTPIIAGSGIALVIATGSHRAINMLSSYLEKSTTTQFQKNMMYISLLLLKSALVLSCCIILIDLLMHKDLVETVLFVLAILIGITPELLPTVITVTLSQAARTMGAKKMLVTNLQSIENLGNMTILCSDKTGTLTEGALHLVDYKTIDDMTDDHLLLYAVISNDTLDFTKSIRSQTADPYNAEIVRCALEHEPIKQQYSAYKLIDYLEFDFFRRKTGYLVEHDQHIMLIARGSADSILACCTSVVRNDQTTPLDATARAIILQRITQYEEQGYRALAIANKTVAMRTMSAADETELTFLGFLLFYDPVKKNALSSLITIKKMGVAVKIISGDSPVITEKICNELGFNLTSASVVSGTQFATLSRSEKIKSILQYHVFARINPDQKQEIVTLLQEQGHTVGFLGDGINDAPALARADVGITVEGAAQVAKKASDIILLEKDLSVIAAGILAGRRAFTNLIKYIVCIISSNIGGIITIALASIILPFIPLLSTQILLISLLTDIPLFLLTSDNIEAASLLRPHSWADQQLTRILLCLAGIGVLFDLVFITLFLYCLHVDVATFRSGFFLLGVLTQLATIFSLRTEKPFFRSCPSRALIGASCAVAIIAGYLPYSGWGALFQLQPIEPQQYLLIMLITALFMATNELAKRRLLKNFYTAPTTPQADSNV